jgi:hypothetical protein
MLAPILFWATSADPKNARVQFFGKSNFEIFSVCALEHQILRQTSRLLKNLSSVLRTNQRGIYIIDDFSLMLRFFPNLFSATC